MAATPLDGLVARASTLRARISGTVDLVPGDPLVAERRLTRWSEQVARGDEGRFATRLALDGLDRERALLVVGEAVPRKTDPLPDRALFVGESLARTGRDDLEDDPCLPAAGEEPVPLQELTVPFVQAARERLATRIARRAVPRRPGRVEGVRAGAPSAARGARLGGRRRRVSGLASAAAARLRRGAGAGARESWTLALRRVGVGRAPGGARRAPLRVRRRGSQDGDARARLGGRNRRVPRVPDARPGSARGDVRRRPSPRPLDRSRWGGIRSTPRPQTRRRLYLRRRTSARLQAEEPPHRSRVRRARRVAERPRSHSRAAHAEGARSRRPRLGRARRERRRARYRVGTALLPAGRNAARPAPRDRRH